MDAKKPTQDELRRMLVLSIIRDLQAAFAMVGINANPKTADLAPETKARAAYVDASALRYHSKTTEILDQLDNL
jgi:hypothetical protein